MRGYVPAYEIVTPSGLEEALRLLAEGFTPLAGGTDLMVVLTAGKLPPARFVNIWKLRELQGVGVTAETVRLGALTTYAQIQRHQVLRDEFPNLVQAAALSGAAAIQTRGTLGGNIVNASPAADSPPALLAYGARLELISPRGTREVDYADFHTGYKQMKREPDELVSAVLLPRLAGRVHYYRKVGTRRAQAISKVCVAAAAVRDNGVLQGVRIGIGSVAPTVVLARRTAEALEGQKPGADLAREAARRVLEEISPIDDIRSSRAYRARVTANLVEELCGSLST